MIGNAEILSAIWLEIIGYGSLLIAISYAIRIATKNRDDDFTPEFQQDLVAQLRHLTKSNATWIAAFYRLFTIVFGSKHLSWRCFLRSATITVVAFLCLGFSFGLFVLRPSQFAQLYHIKYDSATLIDVWLHWLLFMMAFGIFYNGLLDYLSLWGTRIIIKSSLPSLLKIVINLIFTGLIVYIGFKILIAIGIVLSQSIANDTQAGSTVLFEAALFTLQFQNFPPHVGTLAFVILATSYSTSIWLILHILSGWAIKYVPGLFSILNVEKRPIRAIGAMCIAIVWIVGVPTATLMGYKYSDNYFPSASLSEQADTTDMGQ